MNKNFVNEICRKQKEILNSYGIDTNDWTVQEASLAIKRFAENGNKAPEGITKETIDNDYEFNHPTYSEDGTINRFSREIFIEGYEGTWTVVDHQEYDDDFIYELENDNYGYDENNGHILVDKHRNIISADVECDFLYRHECRKCTECGALMVEGFYVDYLEYYCTEECLHKHYTEEEYEQMYEDDYAYWTQWY